MNRNKKNKHTALYAFGGVFILLVAALIFLNGQGGTSELYVEFRKSSMKIRKCSASQRRAAIHAYVLHRHVPGPIGYEENDRISNVRRERDFAKRYAEAEGVRRPLDNGPCTMIILP